MEIGQYFSYSLSLEERQIALLVARNGEDLTLQLCTKDPEALNLSLSLQFETYPSFFLQNPKRVVVISADLFSSDAYRWPQNILVADHDEMPVDDTDPFIQFSFLFRSAVRMALNTSSKIANVPVDHRLLRSLPWQLTEYYTEIGTSNHSAFLHSLEGQITVLNWRLLGLFSVVSLGVSAFRKIAGPITLHYNFDTGLLTLYFNFIDEYILE